MDIVYINQTFGLGGAEHFNQNLIKFLSKNNKVTVYSNSLYYSGSKVPFTVDLIGDWKGFLKGLFYLPFLFYYYIYIIYKNYNSYVFYFTGFIEKILCTPILKLFGKKVVWIEFGPLDSVISKFFHIPELLYRFSANFPDKVIFTAKNSLIKNSHLFPKDIPMSVIPLGSPPPPKKFSYIPPFDGLCVSRLEPGKGQDLLIQAWPADPRYKLIIIGTGDTEYVNRLKNLVQGKNIQLLGYVEDKYSYLKACKFTIFPSIWPLEGFGLVITESFSMGKPVVAFDRPPGNEIIKSNYNGLLGDDLSINIQKILSDKKLQEKLGKNAKKSWQSLYRDDIYLQKYADSLLH